MASTSEPHRTMVELYEELKNKGKTSVDGVIEWMKEAKLIDNVKVTEEKARGMFHDVVDKGSVNLEKFNKTVTELAIEQKGNIESFFESISKEASKVMGAVKAGASAFKDAMTKKD